MQLSKTGSRICFNSRRLHSRRSLFNLGSQWTTFYRFKVCWRPTGDFILL